MTDLFTPPTSPQTARPRLGTFLTANRTRLIITAGALALLAGAPAAFGAVVTPQAASSVTSSTETQAPTPAPTASTTDAKAADKVAAPEPAPSADSAPAPAAAAPEAAPAPAPATPSNTYTVASGDTAGSIASNLGVNLNDMLAANGLSAYSTIFPGEVLKLSGPAIPVSAPAAPAAPATTPLTAPAAAPAAPAAAPAAAAPAAPVAPAVRTIYVAGSGGQGMVDKCIGPIHFTPTDAYSLFIVEHDFCGGWAQFSGIQVGETVNISGYGTYTVTGRGTVPNPGSTNDVSRVLGGMPRAVLQTCIPGTSQMLVIGLN